MLKTMLYMHICPNQSKKRFYIFCAQKKYIFSTFHIKEKEHEANIILQKISMLCNCCFHNKIRKICCFLLEQVSVLK